MNNLNYNLKLKGDIKDTKNILESLLKYDETKVNNFFYTESDVKFIIKKIKRTMFLNIFKKNKENLDVMISCDFNNNSDMENTLKSLSKAFPDTSFVVTIEEPSKNKRIVIKAGAVISNKLFTNLIDLKILEKEVILEQDSIINYLYEHNGYLFHHESTFDDVLKKILNEFKNVLYPKEDLKFIVYNMWDEIHS